jgi:hypothetical protein
VEEEEEEDDEDSSSATFSVAVEKASAKSNIRNRASEWQP